MSTLIFSEHHFGGHVDAGRLHSDINSTITTKCEGVSTNAPDVGRVQIEFETDLPTEEKKILDKIVANHNSAWLDEQKKKMLVEVDNEIERRIRLGFEYPSKSKQIFSLSTNAQIKWNSLFVAKDLLQYPLRVPTIKDETFFDILNAAQVTDIWKTALRTVNQIIVDGTTTKERLMMTNSLADVEATKNAYLKDKSL